MSALNQARALSRIRRALAEAEAEIVESEREYLEAGGMMPTDINNALRALHARVRMANGLITAHAKVVFQEYDDQKTPTRTPSAMMRAVQLEEQTGTQRPPSRTNMPATSASAAFENSVDLLGGKKKP